MSELLWTCEAGTTFSSEVNGVHLVVMRAPSGDGFRYQVLRPMRAQEVTVASGHRNELRDAMAAAERAAGSFAAGVRPTAA